MDRSLSSEMPPDGSATVADVEAVCPICFSDLHRKEVKSPSENDF